MHPTTTDDVGEVRRVFVFVLSFTVKEMDFQS